jgi:hypothetical protein
MMLSRGQILRMQKQKQIQNVSDSESIQRNSTADHNNGTSDKSPKT